MVLILLSHNPVLAFSGAGKGTESEPYQIKTVSDFKEINDDLNAHYILENNLDFRNSNVVIGNSRGEQFTGTLNGNNKTISGFTLNNLSDESGIGSWRYFGLFQSVGYGGTIKNLTLNNVNINNNGSTPKSSIGIGAIAGFVDSSGRILNCKVSGVINLNFNEKTTRVSVGGIVGTTPIESGVISGSINECNINVSAENAHIDVGGITGTGGTKTFCKNFGNITAFTNSDIAYAGGITGSSGPVYSSFNKGNISAKTVKPGSNIQNGNCTAGGIVGDSSNNISQSINYGNVSAEALGSGYAYAGGIRGKNYFYNFETSDCINVGPNISAVSYNDKKEIVESRRAAFRIGVYAKNCYSLNSTLVNGKVPTENVDKDDLQGASVTMSEITRLIKELGVFDENSAYYKLNITPNLLVMTAGDTKPVLCSFYPINNELLKDIIYSVSDNSKGRLSKDSDGKYSFKAEKAGNLVIKFTVPKYPYLYGEIPVTILEPSNKPTYTLDIYPSQFELSIGETQSGQIFLNPGDQQMIDSLWVTNLNQDIIDVQLSDDHRSFKIKGLKAGSASFKLYSATTPGLVTTCTVMVKNSTGDNNSGSGNDSKLDYKLYTSSDKGLSMSVNESKNLWIYCEPEQTDFLPYIKYAVEDPTIVSASKASDSRVFSIKGLAPGETKLTIVDTRSPNIYINIPLRVQESSSNNSNNNGNNSSGNSSQGTNQTQPIYRLYNIRSLEHLYTSDKNEANVLSAQPDWNYEGEAWKAPDSKVSGVSPVYRLYSPVTGNHLFTTDTNEVNTLRSQGWSVDNSGQPLFYSGGSRNIYRLYHEGLRQHLLTLDMNEYNILGSQGWNQEGSKLKAN